MRRRSCTARPFVAIAAALLVSCASAPTRPALTVELFDSVSGPETAGPDAAAAMPLPLPAPAAPPAPAASTAGGVAAAAAPVSAGAAVLMSLAEPGRPGPSTGFALAQPVPPAAASRSPSSQAKQPASRAPAQASAPQGTAAPRPAASSQQAQRQQGAATPQQSGAATPAAGAAVAQQAAGAPATQQAPPYGRLREIYARVGDEMQIGLDGPGYLFLGFPDAQAAAAGMSFKSKESRDGKTWFTFEAVKLGTYDLDFVQQDNTTGSSARETVRVHVLSDQDFAAAVSQSASQAQTVDSAAADAGDPAFASRLSGVGAYEAAVSELLKGYRDGNPDLNDRIAQLYFLMGSYDAAAKYYQKNLAPPGPYADAAVLGLVRVAAAQNDQTGLMGQLKRLLAIQDPSAEEPLILAMRMERDQSQVGVALDLAAEYLSRYPSGRWRDEAEYTAARLLEADSPFRDIAKARDLYGDVVSSYPVGAFAAPARDRLQYIERHFYQIR